MTFETMPWAAAVLPAIVCLLAVLGCATPPEVAQQGPDGAPEARGAPPAGDVELVARGDDMGLCHAANVACIRAYTDGIIRTVEAQSCCPWFMEAAEMLRKHPRLDVGVHLTLTCEWANLRWGPITHAPSLVDEDGYFHPSTEAFRQGGPKADEVERELRAQIARAVKHIPQVSHLSFHMGTPTCTDEFRKVVEKLSAERKLPMKAEGVAGGVGIWGTAAADKADALAEKLAQLKPGRYMFVCHPARETDETRAIRGYGSHDANQRMGAHRGIVTDAVTSERIKDVCRRRGIRLLSYADTYGTEGKEEKEGKENKAP